MASISATGYVHELIDKDQNFEQFVWACARAFGALILMRDDPRDALIPMEFKADDYHLTRVASERAELAQLEAMGERDQLAYGERKKREAIDGETQSKARTAGDVAKCKAMLEQVKAWEPPSEDHAGLKKFMAEQIGQSIEREEDGWHEKRLAELRTKEPLAFYTDAVVAAYKSIAYHVKAHAEEVQRTAQRNAWLAALRQSVPIPKAK